MNQDIRRSKRLYRSREDRLIAGVAGGLAQYFDLDPVLVRLDFLLLGVASGLGLVVYLILAIVIPERPPDEPEPLMEPPRARRVAGKSAAMSCWPWACGCRSYPAWISSIARENSTSGCPLWIMATSE